MGKLVDGLANFDSTLLAQPVQPHFPPNIFNIESQPDKSTINYTLIVKIDIKFAASSYRRQRTQESPDFWEDNTTI
jgi:hypothetical protein